MAYATFKGVEEASQAEQDGVRGPWGALPSTPSPHPAQPELYRIAHSVPSQPPRKTLLLHTCKRNKNFTRFYF